MEQDHTPRGTTDYISKPFSTLRIHHKKDHVYLRPHPRIANMKDNICIGEGIHLFFGII
jgi:hypothetical protein